MRNKIIIISILVILILGIVYMFYINNKKNSAKQDNQNTESNTSLNTERPGFNTNTQTQKPITNSFPPPDNTEINKYNDINNSFSDWKITKDQETLKKLIDLSGGSDNETFYEPWIEFFVSNNSNELMKIVNTSNDKKNTSQKVFYIYEWFIYGSGEYENISAGKKQVIFSEFNQLKKILGIK